MKRCSTCCSGATVKRWAQQITAHRPYTSLQQLQKHADTEWQSMDTPQLLEAFAAHPMIGDVALLKEKYATTARAEQGQVMQADEQTIESLARLNVDYREKFGFIFIVCASGKSAEQMLGLVEARIHNSRDEELANAAEEQRKIMQLRLAKYFEEDS